MIKVKVFKESAYPVSSPKIKKALSLFLVKHGIVSDAEVSVALVGESKMLGIAKKHLNEKGVLHNVLSFPEKETRGDFKYPEDGILHLGEIVVCYKKALADAGQEGVLVEEKVIELVNHGALHLLGIHHS